MVILGIYNNNLIYELIATNRGLLVGTLNIPSILLADDTTLLSTSPNGVQKLQDVVHLYATQWRLKYNATKSSVLIFKPSRNKRKPNDYDNIPSKQGNVTLEVKKILDMLEQLTGADP